jgi:ABC-type phosphate transport system auxiliary subunit
LTSAAKAGIQNSSLIAAVNRCATQKQTAKGVFQQTEKPQRKVSRAEWPISISNSLQHQAVRESTFRVRGEDMDETMTQQMTAAAERMASAAETFDRVLERLDAQYQSLNLKVDRIVAAIEEGEDSDEPTEIEASVSELQKRVAELERTNTELKAQSSRLDRKTLPALVSAVLGKNDLEAGERCGRDRKVAAGTERGATDRSEGRDGEGGNY